MQKIRKRHFLDYGIIIPYVILCVIGLLMVHSSSAYLEISNNLPNGYHGKRQLLFWGISLVLIFLIYKLKIDIFKNKQIVKLATYVIGLLLIVVLFMNPVNGAKGWIQIPVLGSLQPAEFFKIYVIWFLSYSISSRQRNIPNHFKESFTGPLAIIAGMTALLILQPDLGTTVIVVLLVVLMLLASGINYRYTLIVGGAAVVGSTIAIQLMLWLGRFLPTKFQYIYGRFQAFSNPFIDEFDNGHQIVNGYYAMFNGGLFGVGIGNSIQKKGFLKEAHTDYIFAILMEELGLIVALIVLAILFFLIIRILLVGIRSKSPFNSMMCIGIASLLMIQTFVNLGGISGIIPLTGVTFPFLSQGGSSLFALSICVGLALNISAEEKRDRFAMENNQLYEVQ
ncbi:cell division protein FtsW [Enterococcus sp. PF1-24]|uniref:FtsW/RodA/SpoVE family cell cycle protein n=1 Tax=unclassified Enterococcus TaxID=2608891 RepID=UPI0024755010|nr:MULTISPECIES: FtsW/RodA/SpoVE family cell cycle protein [unclassified Enterococcus]MDH6364222.1 cell division protein FtsW [Enterococcus sp. PFB1-1]MDH6401323.1 cell division protein FtsW [Enterococcus sp. PF1-24]